MKKIASILGMAGAVALIAVGCASERAAAAGRCSSKCTCTDVCKCDAPAGNKCAGLCSCSPQANCVGMVQTRTQAQLLGEWKSVDTPSGVSAMLVFLGEGRVTGKGGVNGFNGPYTLTGKDGISFGNLAMTLMAGPEDAMKFEGHFVKTLAEVDGFKIDGDKLTLFAGTSPVLNFERP